MDDLVQYVDWDQIDRLMEESRTIERRRIMFTLHKPADIVQRMINILQAGSYIRPHKHESPDKVETFVVLKGAVVFFWFDPKGSIKSVKKISPDGDIFLADVLAKAWHTYVPIEDNTVVFECKEGPYYPAKDKEFAHWAPAENSPDAEDYVQFLLQHLE